MNLNMLRVMHSFVAFKDAVVILVKAEGNTKIMSPHPSFSDGGRALLEYAGGRASMFPPKFVDIYYLKKKNGSPSLVFKCNKTIWALNL